MRRRVQALTFALLLLAVLAAACESAGGDGTADTAGGDATLDVPGLPDGVAPADVTAEDVVAAPDVSAPDAAPDVAADGGADVPADLFDAGDGSPPRDVLVAVPCDPTARVGETLTLVPDGPRPQIHPDLAFDGHAIWLVWNQGEPEGSGSDVWAMRMTCDGETSIPPFRVQARDDGNDVDPSVVAGPEGVTFAWATDTGGDPNLFVRWRSLDLGGAPRTAGDQTLAPQHDGAPVDASAWMVDLARTPDGRLALTGAWASPAVERWQVFLQRLTGDGAPDGPFVAGSAEAEVSQVRPAIAGTPGAWWVAWERTPDAGALRAVLARVLADGDTFQPPDDATPPDDNLLSSRLPHVAAPAEEGGPVLFAFTQQRVRVGGPEVDVVVRDLRGGAGEDAPSLVLGEGSGQDHSPVVAVAPDGSSGVVAWFRTRSGISNDVHVQAFEIGDAGPVATGEPLLLNAPDDDGDHRALSIYPPSVLALPDGVFVVAWVDGTNPDMVIRARWLAP